MFGITYYYITTHTSFSFPPYFSFIIFIFSLFSHFTAFFHYMEHIDTILYLGFGQGQVGGVCSLTSEVSISLPPGST